MNIKKAQDDTGNKFQQDTNDLSIRVVTNNYKNLLKIKKQSPKDKQAETFSEKNCT